MISIKDIDINNLCNIMAQSGHSLPEVDTIKTPDGTICEIIDGYDVVPFNTAWSME